MDEVDTDSISDRLSRFEPADLDAENSLDAGQADQLVQLFTRLAKGQWKTQQKAGHAAQKVADYLDKRSSRITELKEELSALKTREEQYQRALVEIMDLFKQLSRTASRSDSDELQSASATMEDRLSSIAVKIGLERIPAQGESPDSLYHHIVDTTEASSKAEQNTIVEIARPGYLLRGDVLRKADVIVAK
ncbi:nucleotide exchange factor GrpE [Salinibacter ruber]|uniref:nucleotide exchange factor GrpE n=1 Tax=Salinibacter ruber TaxID=146919 RepID=UPI0021688354|nr:nucleotide exchange factor GrpE [Salinibacter ruber]MCS4056826.1 molecular chaperone GrpE (heat shock protein) [Salinibacter ruber]